LKGVEQPLHPPLGLRRMGRDELDPQLAQTDSWASPPPTARPRWAGLAIDRSYVCRRRRSAESHTESHSAESCPSPGWCLRTHRTGQTPGCSHRRCTPSARHGARAPRTSHGGSHPVGGVPPRELSAPATPDAAASAV
jgi:hypothetical protein